MTVILAGGPEHGRRLPAPQGDYLTVSVSDPQPWLDPDPARPAWWRHPVAWWRRRRWRPAAVLVETGPAVTQHSYRRNGRLADGTPVFWWAGMETSPPDDPAELLRYLYTVAAQVSPWERSRRLRWEMGHAWWAAIQAIPPPTMARLPSKPDEPDGLNGWPVKLTFGAPRLVRDIDSPDWPTP